MRLDRLDRWLGPALTLLALAWLWLAYTYIPGARAEGEPGPRAFPVLLGFALGGLGIVMTGTALVSERGHAGRVLPPSPRLRRTAEALAEAGSDAANETIPPLTRREAGVAASTFGILILYAFLLDKVGFVIATPIVIVLAMYGLLRMRRWVLVLSLAVGFTLGCWVIFDAVLGTPLPRGSWVMWL